MTWPLLPTRCIQRLKGLKRAVAAPGALGNGAGLGGSPWASRQWEPCMGQGWEEAAPVESPGLGLE